MTNLENVKKNIRSTKETAFQRAILQNGMTRLGKKTEIEWLDIELPVDRDDERYGKKRGHCVDLIGKMGENYVICELKFGEDSKDSPKDAVEQVLGYYEKIQRNWENLDKQGLHHPDCKMFKWEDLASEKTVLCVAANAAYWAYWFGHRNVDLSDFKNLKKRVRFYSVDIPSDLFKKQKGDQVKYTPIIETNKWSKL